MLKMRSVDVHERDKKLTTQKAPSFKNISKSNDFDISINQTNFGESMIKFKKIDLKITVQKLISKFLSLLINNVKVQNIKQIKKVICTIPSFLMKNKKI